MSRTQIFARRPRPADPAQAATPARRPIQAKLRIGAVNDPLEREADRVADAVMRGEAAGALGAAPAAPQRMCAGCQAEEEKQDVVQRKCASCGGERETALDGEGAARAVSFGGAPLSPELRAYFEPRFGRDFSDVRVHTGGAAASAARAIDARAYTLGANVAFARGEYAPAAPQGRRLIAHELAHVAQQSAGGVGPVRRTVAGSSSCPANIAGAGATPLDDLRAADSRAQNMALGASNVLGLEAFTFEDPAFGRTYVSDAYQRRFGMPHAAGGGQFFNRLTGATTPTQNDAMREEMLILSTRFQRFGQFLGGPIRYRCPGAAAIVIPGCAAGACDADDNAFSCPGANHMGICSNFWTFATMRTANQRGTTIIHESVHMWLGARGHVSVGGLRLGNPECYAAFVADIFGFAHNDQNDCAATM